MEQIKKYKIGMFGGKFLPFHIGHKYCIEVASKECKIVYVIMFYGGVDEEKILKESKDDFLLLKNRKKQLIKICDEMNIYAKVIPEFIDISDLKTADGLDDWDAETLLVRRIVGDKLDAVYSSEERYGEYFSLAYPEAIHRLVDVKRTHYSISSTEIRLMNTVERKKWMV